MVVVGAILSFSPQTLTDKIHLAVAPTGGFLSASAGDDRLHRHRERSEMAEWAKDEAVDDPEGDARSAPRTSSRSTSRLRRSRFVAAAGDVQADGVPDVLGVTEEKRTASPATRSSASSSSCTRLFQSRRSRRRLLAATILLIATNAGIIGVCACVLDGDPTAKCDRMRRCIRSTGTPGRDPVLRVSSREPRCCPASGVLGNMYASGRVSFTRPRGGSPDRVKAPGRQAPPYRMPGNIPFGGRRHPGVRRLRRIATALIVPRRDGRHPGGRVAGALWMAPDSASTSSTAPPWPDLVTTAKIVVPSRHPRPRPRTSRCARARGRPLRAADRRHRAESWPRGGPRGSTSSAHHRPQVLADRRELTRARGPPGAVMKTAAVVGRRLTAAREDTAGQGGRVSSTRRA